VRALVQRVTEASVTVVHDDGTREVVGSIGPGLVALVWVTHDDTPEQARRLAEKVAGLRVLADDAGVPNVSVVDAGGEVLVVSQFTLYADTSRGRRPSYVDAAGPEHAGPLVDEVVAGLRDLGVRTATGRFRTMMHIALVNDGPVTVLVEVRPPTL
jgi:D-aminoacyl-tRNA deacylase